VKNGSGKFETPQAEACATFYQQHGCIGGTGFSLLRPFSAAR
jgi:hypothetical protein